MIFQTRNSVEYVDDCRWRKIHPRRTHFLCAGTEFRKRKFRSERADVRSTRTCLAHDAPDVKRPILREPSPSAELPAAPGEEHEPGTGTAPAYNSICELCNQRRRCEDSPDILDEPRRLNKLYTYNLTQIPGSKWGLTRGRKGEPEGRREGGPEGSSEADKQNITARVTRKDPGEMRGP